MQSTTKMQDITGFPIMLNDEVVYGSAKSKVLVRGRVVGFGEKMVKVETTRNNYVRSSLRYPNEVVVINPQRLS